MIVVFCSRQPLEALWIGVDGPDDLVEGCGHRLGGGDPGWLVHGSIFAQSGAQLFAQISDNIVIPGRRIRMYIK